MTPLPSAIEALEARIAPALVVLHPIPDLTPGIGKTSATLDLANAFAAAGTFRTHVLFTTNNVDPANPTIPQTIDIELFDDKAPLTVANFLRYVNGLAPSDYDGVFFHRAIPGFVLQGGGFEAAAPLTHIATDPVLHNEFTAGDSERSNLAGTIAMAKTGLGPHTADSEWFFNLGDNSANLDNQNGGFTVFAKVTQGMNVVNAIAALNRTNLSTTLNSALTDVPLQNYNADPDGNSATPPPTPTAAQFITITHAAVIAPPPASAVGVSFALAGITDATTQAPTDLVSGSVVGQSLQLQYKAGASGVAKVIVKASKVGEADVFEDFLVTLKPNLITSTTNNPFATVLVPGDKTTVSVQVTNSGGAATSGSYDVTFYLSKIGGSDAQGQLVEPGVDAIIGTLASQTLNLASGAKTTLSTEVTIPQKLLATQAEYYRVLAEVKPATGAATELFTDDNVTLNSPQHRLYNAFGSFAGRTDVALTYVDAANHTVTATLTGGGFGQFDPQGAGELGKLAIYQTLATSEFNVAAPGGTALDALYLDTVLGTASLADVSVKTSFDAHAGVKTLTLGSFGDGLATRPFSIGAFAADSAQKVTLTLGAIRDVQFTSAMPIGEFKAVNWLDADAEADVLTAPALDSLFLTGDATTNGAFQADLNVTGPTAPGSFKIAYLDSANRAVTAQITGGGYSHFTPQRGGATGALEVLGTTAGSSLTLLSAAGTTLDSIDIATPLGAASLAKVVLKGNFNAHGGLTTLILGNIGDGTATRAISIGAFAANPAQKVAVTLGQARDVVFISAMPLGALTAADWLDSDGSSELIAAPAIDSVNIRGSFQADLTITGTTKLQSFLVGGTVSSAHLQIAGDVGLIRLGALVRSQILVGVTDVPRRLTDFAGTHDHRIETFKILNSAATGTPLIDSLIVAARILTVALDKVAPNSGTARFGFIADRINSYQVGTIHATGLAAPLVFDARNHYAVRIV